MNFRYIAYKARYIFTAVFIILVIFWYLFSPYAPNWIQKLKLEIIQPKDLYSNIYYKEIEKNIKTHRLEFINKYVGTYAINIITDYVDPIIYGAINHKEIALDVRIKLKFWMGEQYLREIIVDNVKYPFFGGKKQSGVAIFVYKTPEDLPVSKKLICEMNIEELDERIFCADCNPAITIRKLSDH